MLITSILVLPVVFSGSLDLGINYSDFPDGALVLASEYSPSMLTSRAMLYNYYGEPIMVWKSGKVDGVITAVTFLEISGDMIPEVVVSTSPVFHCTDQGTCYFGNKSLLIYRYTNGTWELSYSESREWGTMSSDIARARLIDYFDNGTKYLIDIYDTDLVLVRYDTNGESRFQRLDYLMGWYGFDVGDVNHDGREDIVHVGPGGILLVQENLGNGVYVEKKCVGKLPDTIDEIRIGDVDGDAKDEVVVVGNGRAALGVFEYTESGYNLKWSYRPDISIDPAIQCLDIGDVDGDGKNEIVTAAEIGEKGDKRGLSIWKYQPRIEYGGTVLEEGDKFFRLWEDTTKLRDHVTGMLALKTANIDDDDECEIIGLRAGQLYIADKTGNGYNSEKIEIFYYTEYSRLDVWPQKEVNERETGQIIGSLIIFGGIFLGQKRLC